MVSLTGPSHAAPGTNVTYVETATNSGSNPALSFVLANGLPSGTTFVSQTQVSGPTLSLGYSGGIASGSISSLPAGSSVTVDVVFAFSSSLSNGTNVTDGAGVTTTTTLSGSSVTSASVTTTAQYQADLAVTCTDPVAAAVGSNLTYTITLTNNGPRMAQSVTLTDTLPSGTTYVSQSQSSGPSFTLSHSGGVISDTITALASGYSATFSVTASVNSGVANGTLLTTTPSASSTTTDPKPGNNSVPVTSFVDPVTLTSPGNQSSMEGATVSLSLSASDSISGATLHYAAQGLPPGLKINPSTGAITGTVGLGDGAASPYTTTVTASDGTYSATQAFTWTVSSPVSLTNPGTQTSAEGATVSLSLSASDSSSGTLSYAAVGLPTGLKINTSTGAITGTVAVGTAADSPYPVTVTAADGTYEASQTFTWKITSPVTMPQLPDQTNNEGDSVSLAISASDSSSGTLVYTATGLPLGLKISTSSGTITGAVGVNAAAGGPYNVTVTANDGTYRVSQSFTWYINSPVSIVTPADQTNKEGDSVSLAISASDASSGTLTYGAIGLPGGLSINASTGAISGTVAVGDAANGQYTVTLFAEDGTYSAQTTFAWTINDPITIAAIADQSSTEGGTPSLTVSATDTHSGTLAYSASGLPTGLSISSSTGAISGTFTAAGSFTPTVTVNDGTYSASLTFNWTVNGPISITDPGVQTYNAGDAVSLPIQATDTASGTLGYSASGLPSSLGISSSTGLISGTLSSSLTPGNYTTTVTVSAGTNTSDLSLSWTIYPSSAVTVTNPGTHTNNEGDTVSWSVSASDSSSGTLSYAAIGLPPGLKINPSSGAISGTLAAGDAVLSPFITTVITTDGTNFDSQSFTWNVNPTTLTLTAPSNQTNNEGDSVSLTLNASYSGSGSVTYSALGLPAGLTLKRS
jgi:uncharacterized repeat protein (TIGR01451 family)